jgi:HSP20 family molecular chaperone IbpA
MKKENSLMKNILSNRAVIFVLSFIFGGLFFLGINHFYKQKVSSQRMSLPFAINQGKSDDFFNKFFNNDFFDRSRDPFEEMRRMQKQMLQGLNSPDELQGGFDSWFQNRFGGGNVNEIKQREDDKYVYYDIDLNNQSPKELQVEVKDGQVNISGKFETKSQNGNENSVMSSSFHRSFPVPPNVEADKFLTEQENNKIVLKFPKKK